MAARLRKTHQEDIRTKIKVSQLINVLENHALGITEELTQSRIKSIEILLNKTLPNLQSTEFKGDADSPLAITLIERKIVRPNNSDT